MHDLLVRSSLLYDTFSNASVQFIVLSFPKLTRIRPKTIPNQLHSYVIFAVVGFCAKLV